MSKQACNHNRMSTSKILRQKKRQISLNSKLQTHEQRERLNTRCYFVFCFFIFGAELEKGLLIHFRHIQSYLNKIRKAFVNERKLIQLVIFRFHPLFNNWAGKTGTNLLQENHWQLLKEILPLKPHPAYHFTAWTTFQTKITIFTILQPT